MQWLIYNKCNDFHKTNVMISIQQMCMDYCTTRNDYYTTDVMITNNKCSDYHTTDLMISIQQMCKDYCKTHGMITIQQM